MIRKTFFTLLLLSAVASLRAQNLTNTALALNTAGVELALNTNPNTRIQFNQNELNLVLDKAGERHPLEKTGRILTYVGVPLAVLGAVMVSGADELYYNCTNGNCEGDPQGGFGVMLLGAGAGMAGTGIVLWTIGAKK
ncbi:MAG: hypothetical protein ABJH05_15520 [Fulvivirga sp.]